MKSLDAETFEHIYTNRITDSCGRAYAEGSIIKDKDGVYHQMIDYNTGVHLEKLEQMDAASFRLKETTKNNKIIIEDKNGSYSIQFQFDGNPVIVKIN